MITDNGHVDTPEDVDLLADTVNHLQSLASALGEHENRLAAELAAVREKRSAAEKALGTFTGTVSKKRRGRPRKQAQDAS